MKSFTKAVSDITQNLVKTFKKACDVAIDPNRSSDMEQVWRDFENACKDAGNTSTDAAHDEVKEHLARQMQGGGMSKAEFEKWFEQKWKDVKDLGDKVIEAAPKVKRFGKFLRLKILGAIAIGGVFIYRVGHERPSQESIRMQNRLQYLDSINQRNQSIQIKEDQFHIMTANMQIASTPIQMPMPVAVAAVAEKPVKVQVTTPSGTRSFTSTIRQVYQNVSPQAQQKIEQDAPKIDHDYDHQDTGFHKTFTVDSPVGSATFSY